MIKVEMICVFVMAMDILYQCPHYHWSAQIVKNFAAVSVSSMEKIYPSDVDRLPPSDACMSSVLWNSRHIVAC